MAGKVRHQLFLDKPLSDRLKALASKPGASKSAILADAVTAWLNRRAVSEKREQHAGDEGAADQCPAPGMLAASPVSGESPVWTAPLIWPPIDDPAACSGAAPPLADQRRVVRVAAEARVLGDVV